MTEGKKSKRTGKKGENGSPKQGSENGSENELDASENNVKTIDYHELYLLLIHYSSLCRELRMMTTGPSMSAKLPSKLEWKF